MTDVIEDRERQTFRRTAPTTAGATVAGSTAAQAAGRAEAGDDKFGRSSINRRKRSAREIRRTTANQQFAIPDPGHPANGDEDLYADFRGSYSKGLAHDADAFVNPASFIALQTAAQLGTQAAFNNPLLRNGVRRQTNPLNTFNYQLIGADSHNGFIAAAPAFASRNTALDMLERYWMALCRDIPFIEYDSDPTVAAACADLNGLGWEEEFGFECTPDTLFRAPYAGVFEGPWISQFLLRDFFFGNQRIVQATRYPKPGMDYLTTWADFAAVNDGTVDPTGSDVFVGERHISTLRDGGQWVHVDQPTQSPIWAALLSTSVFGGVPGNYNPYFNDGITTSAPFGSLGTEDFVHIAATAGLLALKHAWFQKWCVHRRLRPEVFAARIHLQLTTARDLGIYPGLFNSAVLPRIASHNQAQGGEATYLLPMAFPEGSPTHPAYPGGHSTFVSAGVTVIKALIADRELTDNVQADAGGNLVPYAGTLTLHGELNKLVSNITHLRDGAGMHWRTDGALSGADRVNVPTGGNPLGEALAISMLSDLRQTYREVVGPFRFTRFDGTMIEF